LIKIFDKYHRHLSFGLCILAMLIINSMLLKQFDYTKLSREITQKYNSDTLIACWITISIFFVIVIITCIFIYNHWKVIM
jgi:hypothetical protein